MIADRALQAAAVNALEPEWEARFDPNRTGSGRVAAAMTRSRPSTRLASRNAKRLWVLDADLEAAFDRLGHDPSSLARQVPRSGTGLALAKSRCG